MVVNVELGHLHLSTDPAHSGRDTAPHNQRACVAVGLTDPGRSLQTAIVSPVQGVAVVLLPLQSAEPLLSPSS